MKIVSYPRYCRCRSLLKRFEGKEDEIINKENIETRINISNSMISSSSSSSSERQGSPSVLGAQVAENNGISMSNKENSSNINNQSKIRILFCRDTFEHESLLHNELNCDHLGKRLIISSCD